MIFRLTRRIIPRLREYLSSEKEAGANSDASFDEISQIPKLKQKLSGHLQTNRADSARRRGSLYGRKSMNITPSSMSPYGKPKENKSKHFFEQPIDKSHIIYRIQAFSDKFKEKGTSGLVEAIISKFKDLQYKEKSCNKLYEHLSDQVLTYLLAPVSASY